MTPNSGALVPLRGQVWTADLDPAVGDEMQKARRVVVVGIAEHRPLKLRVVVPVTSYQPKHDQYPSMVKIEPRPPVFTKKVCVDCLQIRSLDTSRFLDFVGVITPAEEEAITDALAVVLNIE